MLPQGLPALFVPGNAGSYKQVRSFGSETARQYARAPPGARGSDLDWCACVWQCVCVCGCVGTGPGFLAGV